MGVNVDKRWKSILPAWFFPESAMTTPDLAKAVLNHSDEKFDSIFPIKYQKLSSIHWTPVKVALRAADYLVQSETTKVLDIGSGVGKFCIAAAAVTSGHFTGVEQRESLVRLSKKIAARYQIKQVNFIHADIRTIDLAEYDAFYFFNSFEENRNLFSKIDDEVKYDPFRYEAYMLYLFDRFDTLPVGTRIVTYCTFSDVVPDSFALQRIENKGKLKYWIKRV